MVKRGHRVGIHKFRKHAIQVNTVISASRNFKSRVPPLRSLLAEYTYAIISGSRRRAATKPLPREIRDAVARSHEIESRKGNRVEQGDLPESKILQDVLVVR